MNAVLARRFWEGGEVVIESKTLLQGNPFLYNYKFYIVEVIHYR